MSGAFPWREGLPAPKGLWLLGATLFKGFVMLESFLLGCCPRCRGDLAHSRDQWGPYWHCLQCGWHEKGPVQQRADLPRWLTGVAADRAGKSNPEDHALASLGGRAVGEGRSAGSPFPEDY